MSKPKLPTYDPTRHALIPLEDAWPLLLHDVRYSLGRMTYAVNDACRRVRLYAVHLQPWQVKQIGGEVRRELMDAGRDGRLLGQQCDHHDWTRLAEWCEKEVNL